MTHTPGPWWVGGGGSEVFGPSIMAEGLHETEPLAAVDHLSANVEADARLIAAAPDLLSALEDAAEGLHGEFCTGGDWRVCDGWQHREANAAIAKAKGEPTE